MKAFFEVRTGGISDNLLQLEQFATLCLSAGIEPALAPPNSGRYTKNSVGDISLEELSRQLFGPVSRIDASLVKMEMSEFMDGLEHGRWASQKNSFLVRGDSAIYERTRHRLNSLWADQPDRMQEHSDNAVQWLTEHLQRGEIYRRYRQRSVATDCQPDSPLKLSIHYRLGDLALICRSKVDNHDIRKLMPKEFFCPFIGFQTAEELERSLERLPFIRHRNIDEDHAQKFLDKAQEFVQSKAPREVRVTFCTDGYTRAARVLARQQPGLDHREIEGHLNRMFLSDLMGVSDRCFVGEHEGMIMDVIDTALDTDLLLMGSSYFPLRLRKRLGIPNPEFIRIE